MAAVVVTDPDPIASRDVLGVAPIDQPAADPFAAAFRQGNTFVSVLHAQRNSGPFAPEPDYNPIDDIKDTPYFQTNSHDFVASHSRAETQAIMRRINQEEADRRAIANAGVLGTVATLAAGILDPTMFLPFGAGARATALRSTFLAGARDVGMLTAKAVAAQEFVLGASQQNRTLQESLEAIASGTLLWGLIGGGAHTLLRREGRLEPTTALLAQDRAEMTRHNAGIDEAPPARPAAAAGIEALHASRHEFDAFDLAKVGTGEGPAGSGIGMHLTTGKDTHEYYLQHLGGESPVSYRVKVDAKLEDFLDLDKNLNEQSPQVQKAVEALPGAISKYNDNPTGREIFENVYAEISGQAGQPNVIKTPEREKRTSDALREAGIVGTRSLGEFGGDNLVVFDTRKLAVAERTKRQADLSFLNLPEPPIQTVTPRGDVVEVQPAVVAPPPPEAPQRGPRGRDPETYSLFEYLASRGGLQPTEELLTLFGGNPFVPGFGALLRKSGMSLDRAWEAATRDAKYIFDVSDRAGGEAKTTTNQLLEMLGEERRGNKQYQVGAEGTKSKAQLAHEAEGNRVQIERALDDHFAEHGFGEPDPKLYKRAVQIMEKEGEHDPGVAYERAVMENADRYEQLAAKRIQTIGDIPGWDAADIGAAPGAGRGLPEAGVGLDTGGGAGRADVGEAARLPGEGGGGEGSVGAAAADTRRVEQASTFGLSEATRFRNPMARLLTSASVWARRTAMDLADTPLLTREQLAGQLSAHGASLERRAILAINQAIVAVGDKLDSLWKDLRFAGTDVPWLAKQRDELGLLGAGRAPELPTFAQFKEQVAQAMREGDVHAIPQVQEAAEFIRARVFDLWKERGQQAGLLPPGEIVTKTADSYLQRIYNKQAIAAQQPRFVNIVTSWLESDQATKAQAKERLTLYNAQLQSFNNEFDKLEARFGRAEERARALDIRAAERSRDDMPKTAGMNEPTPTGRTAELQERAATIKAEAKELNEAIDLMEELVGQNPQLAGPLARTEAKLERRNVAQRVAEGRHAEAGMAAKRSEKRLAALEEQLGKVEDRKATIEEYLALADAFRAEIRGKIEKELGAWEGHSSAEAKSAIKAREKYAKETARSPEAARLTSADKAVDDAVQSIIESDRDLSRDELRSRAQEITRQILGTPDGRLPYDLADGGPEIGVVTPRGGQPPRGPLARREFMIPDALIGDFLENDIERVVRAHLRTMVPDVMLTERFGDVRMTETLKKIAEDYDRLIDQAGSDTERTKLGKERNEAIRDVAGIRDRLRGVYGQDQFNNMRMAGRVVGALKNLNVIESMGMAAVSSLSDMAGVVFRYGLGAAFNDAWAPYVRSLMSDKVLNREALRQFRAMGIAVEADVASRHQGLMDTMEGYHPQSRLERTLQWGADRFQLINGLAQWTDRAKTWAATVASQEIFTAARAAVEGTASQKQLMTLAEAHILPELRGRIAEQYATHGNVVDGVHLPNTEMWTDVAARDAFEAAVARDADIAVVSPGQEKPLFMSDPVLSVFTQFKSFVAASTERTLVANIQRRDAQVMQGVIASLALGMVSYKINAMLGGQPTSDRPQDWIKESLSRGGMLGWIEEANAMASKMSRGGVDMYRLIGADKPLSRYAGRSVLDQVLGPTAGKIEALTKVTGALGTLDWNAADTTAARKLVAFQNVFYLRGLFNQAEAAFNQSFGIPPKEQRP